MRILFHTYSLAHQSPGGGERVISALQSALVRNGLQVTCFQPWTHNPSDFDIIHYFSILESPIWRYFHSNFPAVPLVITPTFYGGNSGFSLYAQRVKDTLLSQVSTVNRSSIRDFKIPDKFFPSTQFEATSLNRRYGIPMEKMEVFANGIDDSFFQQESEEKIDWPSFNEPFVLHVGRFHPVKRQKFLIQAMKGENIPCVLVGDRNSAFPEYFDECAALAKGHSNLQIVSGINPNSRLLREFYRRAGLFVFPSEFETFGIAPLEAAALGCPLLLSDQIVCPEIFSDFSEFLPIQDPKLWRSKIKELMGRKVKISREKISRIQNNYNWDQIAVRMMVEYKKLLA